MAIDGEQNCPGYQRHLGTYVMYFVSTYLLYICTYNDVIMIYCSFSLYVGTYVPICPSLHWFLCSSALHTSCILPASLHFNFVMAFVCLKAALYVVHMVHKSPARLSTRHQRC